ncbi:MAG: hypothetical protein BWX97_00519 [Firmicutes bacterium ADurb.Bin146]|jgi:hypothetical protein|nr:MAG: hypothetical protein BWX97_00519 [Firmicutes bacterium ADurb.Bin146]
MEKDKKVKKNLWILIICIIVVVLVATALIVFRDELFKQKKSNNNLIVIERIDGQDSLRMPQQYLDKILMDKSFYIDENASISMSSVEFEIGEEGIKWGMDQGGLVNTADKDAIEILGGIKYCKGISDMNVIVTEKKNSSVEFYEGYSAEMFMNNREDYVIIPSSMSKFINENLAPEEKRMILRHSAASGYLGFCTIIGEYTTKDEYDTIYVSYSSMASLIKATNNDMSEYVDTLEIKLNEGKDYTKLIEYLSTYFADANSLEKYEGKTNRFDDPYMYQFVH